MRMDAAPLPADFYDADPVSVARALIGMRLVRQVDGERISGIIVEAEAYNGETDLACHARSGRTARNAAMYGPPGRAYVYFTYGMHWCLNAVTGPTGYPAAVLIRAILPREGIEQIAARRAGVKPALWTNGPAKLTSALAIDGSLNGCDLTDINGGLWIEAGEPISAGRIRCTPRVGIENTPEPWRSLPWRFIATG